MEDNIPDFLIDKLRNQYGNEINNQILKGFEKKRPVTLRVNTIKSTCEEIEKCFFESNIEFEKVNFYDCAYIIKNVKEDEICELDIYKEGKIYLQSLSSMLPPIVLEPKENEDILDMAAAPGGKTTEIAAITNNNSNITACELNSIRAERLKYNIEKQGATSVYVMQKDARNIDDFFSFDRILLDAPCSGSGTLNVKEDVSKYFSIKLIEKSSKAQLALLKKAINILKPGHEMVYSTCSILKEENEDIVNEVLETGKVEIIPIEYEWVNELHALPTEIPGTLCIMPNELFEGFYIAKLKKK
ncbi:MAG: RsmB/NOP family class I SAM-dependent RNA methyltransferase [Clostridia bacterium]|nr:RsmB/NOP family class I SAM-dependent RNA methyltransferase [Clostridia bacterium]